MYWLIAFSLGSLFLLKQMLFYIKAFHPPAHPYDYVAIVIVQLVLTGCFFIGRRWKFGYFLALMALWNIFFPFLLIRTSLPVLPLYLLSLLTLGVWYLKWRASFLYLSSRALLVTSPLFLIITLSFLMRGFALLPLPPIEQQEGEGDVRLFVLLFDELDQTAMYDHPMLELPHFNAFAEESFYATAAYPAGKDTALSIPSMTTGERIREVNKKWELNTDTRTFQWRHENLFADLSHKNCTAIGGLICDFQKLFSLTHHYRGNVHLGRQCLEEGKRLCSLLIPSLHRGVYAQLTKLCWIASYKKERAALLESVQDPSLSFCFAHLIGAHYPPFYDRERARFSVFRTTYSYLDNLALADRTLGEFQQALQASGLEEKTIVIVTSDHWWRIFSWKAQGLPIDAGEWETYSTLIDHRVPFMIKGFGSEIYNTPCSNLALRALVNAIFDGAITSTADLATFFDRQTAHIETWPDLLY